MIAQELVAQVSRLSHDSAEQYVQVAKVAKRARFLSMLTAVSIILLALLMAGLGFGMAELNQNSDNINLLAKEVQAKQKLTEEEALCPLYNLFLISKSPERRAQHPAGPKAYDEAFEVIQDGYDALGCKKEMP